MSRPPLRTQLRTGSGTEGKDCVAVTCCNLLNDASDGKVGPKVQKPGRDPQSVGSWVRYLRDVTDNQDDPLLIYGDAFDILTSPQVRAAFRAANVRPPTVTYEYGMEFGDLRKWLQGRRDRFALLAYDYGVARRDGAIVGSESFSDAHASAVGYVTRRRVRVGKRKRLRLRWFWEVGDPLYDGRRRPGSTKRYPRGRQTDRVYRYRRAAGAFGTGPDGRPRPVGFGRVVCIKVQTYD